MMPGPAGPVRVNKRGVIVQKLSYPYHDDERYASLARTHWRFQERQTHMNKRYVWPAPMLSVLLLASCAATRDLAHYMFPKAQAKIHATLNAIINDAETTNVQNLRDSHLNSDKFTKFRVVKKDGKVLSAIARSAGDGKTATWRRGVSTPHVVL